MVIAHLKSELGFHLNNPKIGLEYHNSKWRGEQRAYTASKDFTLYSGAQPPMRERDALSPQANYPQ